MCIRDSHKQRYAVYIDADRAVRLHDKRPGVSILLRHGGGGAVLHPGAGERFLAVPDLSLIHI